MSNKRRERSDGGHPLPHPQKVIIRSSNLQVCCIHHLSLSAPQVWVAGKSRTYPNFSLFGTCLSGDRWSPFKIPLAFLGYVFHKVNIWFRKVILLWMKKQFVMGIIKKYICYTFIHRVCLHLLYLPFNYEFQHQETLNPLLRVIVESRMPSQWSSWWFITKIHLCHVIPANSWCGIAGACWDLTTSRQAPDISYRR